MDEKISIIVPVYNVKQYLNKCIDSIVNQTYKNLEIVLVDDGSTDDSGIICDQWEKKDRRIKVIHKKNGGLSSARNAGLDVVSGQYIMFVDSDDWIDDNTVEELLKIEKKGNFDFVSCSLIEEYNTETEQHLSNCNYQVFNQKELFFEMLNDKSVAGYAWNKLFKRNIVDGQFFNEKVFWCEDFEFCSRIAINCNRIAFCDAKFYHYRKRCNSLTSDLGFNEKKLSLLKSSELIMSIYQKYDNEHISIIEKNYLKQNLNLKGRFILSKINDDDIAEMLNKNIGIYYPKVIHNNKISILEKSNIFISRLFPALSLKIKRKLNSNVLRF